MSERRLTRLLSQTTGVQPIEYTNQVTPHSANHAAIAAANAAPPEDDGSYDSMDDSDYVGSPENDEDHHLDDEFELYDGLPVAIAPKISVKTNPWAGVVDVGTKDGAYLFRKGGELPAGYETKMSPEYKTRKVFMEMLQAKQQECNYSSLLVPLEGDGSLKSAEQAALTPHNPSNFSRFVNMWDVNEFAKISEERIKQWCSWYNGGEGSTAILRNPGMPMIRHAIDPNEPGLMGMQNMQRHARRVSSEMLYNLSKAILTASAFKAFNVHKKLFTYIDERDQREVADGTYLFWMICRKVMPSLKVTSTETETKIRTATLKSCNDNVGNFCDNMQYWQTKMVEEGRDCSDNFLIEHLFRGLKVHGQGVSSALTTLVDTLYMNWIQDKEGFSKDTMVLQLANLYTNLSAAKVWKVVSPVDKKISLATKAKTSLNKVYDIEKALTTVIERLTNKKAPSSQAWKFKKVGETAKDPDSGKTMKWCPIEHGGGCYMPLDHDHDKWKAEKAAKAARRSQKQRHVANATTADEKDERANKKLKLDPAIKAALTTSMASKGYSQDEIDEVFDFGESKE
jgi:hypothetical protein